MGDLFLKLLNMSITAGWIVVAAVLLRPLLKKAPRWIHCTLWGMVGLRLILPVSLESILSLIPSAETVPQDIVYMDTPAVHSGVSPLNSTINPILAETMTPQAGDSVNPMQVAVAVATVVWLVGVAAMVVYAVISYWRIKTRTREGVKLYDNVYLCDRIDTPFILGVVKPKVYLPCTMQESDREYVIAHETAHLKRFDHIWKPLGFALLTVYWFHPLLWVAYILLCRDIELACDEKVMKEQGEAYKKPYAEALINCSVPRRMIAACPLAFGEVNVKNRIKSILNYKRPAFWIVVVSLVAVAVAAVCLLTNPVDDTPVTTKPVPQGVLPVSDTWVEVDETVIERARARYPQFFDLDTSAGLIVDVWQMAEGDLRCHLESAALDAVSDNSFAYTTGVSVPEMRVILTAYDLPQANITVRAVQNPLSSYAYTIDEQYIADLHRCFWVGVHVYESDWTLDTAVFDINGDGKDERCALRPGGSSGVTSFMITVEDQNTTTFSTFWYGDSITAFGQDEKGKTVLVANRRNGTTAHVRMRMIGGRVVLSQKELENKYTLVGYGEFLDTDTLFK